MIGVYDSGLGGLTVLAALRAAGIGDDVVYFADQAHVPYGERTDADLHGLLTANLTWLAEHGVDLVVMGCNTSCAVAAGSRPTPIETWRSSRGSSTVSSRTATASVPTV